MPRRNISVFIILIVLACCIAAGIVFIVNRNDASDQAQDLEIYDIPVNDENVENLSKLWKVDFNGKRLVRAEYMIDEYDIPYLVAYCDGGSAFQEEYSEAHHGPLIQEIPEGDKLLFEKKGIDPGHFKDHWWTMTEYPLEQSYCTNDMDWYLLDETASSGYDLIIVSIGDYELAVHDGEVSLRPIGVGSCFINQSND